MANLLIEYTPFRPTITESKQRPGVFEVTGVMQRANAKNQNGRIYEKKILMREVDKYMESFVGSVIVSLLIVVTRIAYIYEAFS